jgi:hypothetical protein
VRTVFATELSHRRAWYRVVDEDGRLLHPATTDPAGAAASALIARGVSNPYLTLVMDTYTYKRKDFTVNSTVGTKR